MPAVIALDPLAPSKAGLVPGDLIYDHDKHDAAINHTAIYVGQRMKHGILVGIGASVEFVHLT